MIVEFAPTTNPIINLATVATQKFAIKNKRQLDIPIRSANRIIVLLPLDFNNYPVNKHPIDAPKGITPFKIPVLQKKYFLL